jgi:hypothetical protein
MPAHLVLSIPKCGGTTIQATLQQTFPAHAVGYVHAISRVGLTRLEAVMRPSREVVHGAIFHLEEAREAKMMVEERRAQFGRPIGYYITSVRDPLALALAGWFQGYDQHVEQAGRAITADYVRESMQMPPSVLSKDPFFYDGLDVWFDREFKETLGVDVFKQPFDHEQGYALFRENGVNVLVMRQENFGILSQALGELYDLPEQFFPTCDANRAKDKPYADIYESIKKDLEFDDTVLDQFYDNPFCRHFYSETEVLGFRQKWGGVAR